MQTESRRLAQKIRDLLVISVTIYAISRYVLLGTVPAYEIPIFILNKVSAVSGTLLIAFSLSIGPLYRMTKIGRRILLQRKDIGLAGFGFVAIHVLMTNFLAGPKYFPKFYVSDGSGLNFLGQISILMGMVALICFTLMAVTSPDALHRDIEPLRWRKLHRFGVYALAMTGLHVGVIAFPSWMTPEKWPGYLLPLTLITCVGVLTGIALRLAEHCLKRIQAHFSVTHGLNAQQSHTPVQP